MSGRATIIEHLSVWTWGDVKNADAQARMAVKDLTAAGCRLLGPDELDRLEAEWTRADFLRLHAGEMSAQEMRTAKAVIHAFAAAIRALAEREG